MVRQYDYLNQYYCPEGACVRAKSGNNNIVGPASAFVECYDVTTDKITAPLTWNPVYDKNTPAPVIRQARQCTTVKTNNSCWSILTLLALLSGLVIISLVFWWVYKLNQERASTNNSNHAYAFPLKSSIHTPK